MRKARVVVVVGLAVAALAAAAPVSRPSASSKPTSIPTSRPVAKKLGASDAAARTAVKNAVASLNKEFEASLRKPATNSLRATCNYFADHPSKDLTADAILPALAGPGVGDGRATAYVRWQLLSGMPAKLATRRRSSCSRRTVARRRRFRVWGSRPRISSGWIASCNPPSSGGAGPAGEDGRSLEHEPPGQRRYPHLS
jgi:hypothetical protein